MFGPLDDDRAAPAQNVVDADGVGVGGAVETVAVEVKEQQLIAGALVFVDEAEGRAGERDFRAPAFSDADGESGFPRAEIARETDHVPGLQERAETNPQPPRLL